MAEQKKKGRKSKFVSDADKAAAHSTKFKSKAETAADTGVSKKAKKQAASHTAAAVTSGTVHSRIHSANEDDNAGVNAADYGAESAEGASNVLSRLRQKSNIKKEYASMKAGKTTTTATAAVAENASAAKKTASAAEAGASMMDKLLAFAKEHSKALIIIGIIALLILLISSSLASCSTFLEGGGNVVLVTSYTAEDEDIIGANNDYKALEAALQSQIDNIEQTHSGYDEYNYYLDEIGHDPYQLASYLTVMYEDYTRSEVQSMLQSLFDRQYTLTLEEVVEVRYRTETRTGSYTYTDPETGETETENYEYEVEVPYNYYILNVTLTNNNLDHVITESGGMDDDQAERYAILLQTKGNRPDLFADDPYVASGDYLDYDIPGEALTDEKFANMIREAEKYLGYPYVWGGSSPSTSFDCSGFVSWVINNCGNGWSVGRLTANGLKNICSIIPASEAKPGDLIFFQGTYSTSGASHVGIYVGNGMMIHCGSVRPDRTEVEVDERRIV